MKPVSDIKSRVMFALSMFIFGTIGILRKYILLPSGIIAMARGMIGLIFLLIVILIKKDKISFKAIRKNLLLLCLSGISLGANWMLLFEAYEYTRVSTATLCYYMAPVIIVLVSPAFFKEKLTVKKALCVAAACFGMTLVSGVMKNSTLGANEAKGILLGLSAALFYACVVIMNKKIHDISPYDKTMVQLAVSTTVLIPYTIITGEYKGIVFDGKTFILLIVAGVLHTGIAYMLYFGTISKLKSQTVALFSYIDPIIAILLSALFLKERIGLTEGFGAAIILSATAISELLPDKKRYQE